MTTRLAVVGFGAWGQNLARNFFQLGVLEAICDSDAESAAKARATYPDVAVSQEIAQLLADETLDAVVIASPSASHGELTRRCLEAGKDVFVEKPLALNLEEAEELEELGRSRERVLMVGHVLRYHPAVSTLARLISEGTLGEIRYLYSNRLNIGRIRTEENILWSFAPHDISIMLALLGEEPASCSCHGAAYLSREVADVTLSELLFPSGVRAHIFVSWLHPFKEQRLVVVGSERMAVFEDTAAEKLVLFPHRVEWRQRIPTAVKADGEKVAVDDVEPLRSECQHFLACMADRRQPLTDGHEALRVVRLLNALQESLERGGQRINLGPAKREGRGSGTGPGPTFVHPTAVTDQPCEIGEGTRIWHFCHVSAGAVIGRDCVLGQNCFVASRVKIGDGVKVQNNVSIYTGTTVEDFVFLGPSCVLTNVTNPRSEVNRHSLYEGTVLRRGCSIGANATVVCGVEVGRYAFVAAGAVVTRSVPDYALVSGVPGRRVSWMSRHGIPLGDPDTSGVYTCRESGLRYREASPGELRCLDLDEDAPLPGEMATGHVSYDDIVHPGGRHR